jgi:flagellar brake protein
MEKDSDYYVKNPKQIVSYLNQLMQKKCLIAVHFGENNDSFLTSIIQIDQKKKLLMLDYGPKDYLNKQLLQAKKPDFRSVIDGIKVAFNANKVSSTQIKGQAAFVLALPDNLYWLQRRKFYRVRVPLSHKSFCTLRFQDEQSNITTGRFRLQDISITGAAFINEELDFSNQLLPTTLFENSTIQLNDITLDNLTITIKNKTALVPNRPDKGQRIGCEFSGVTPNMESAIQRYMQDIELEARATS